MSDWLSLYWSTSVAVAVPSAPPIACQNWTLVAWGFFGGLRLEVPTGVPCAATVEPGAAPPAPPAPVVAAAVVPAGLVAVAPAPPAPPPVAEVAVPPLPQALSSVATAPPAAAPSPARSSQRRDTRRGSPCDIGWSAIAMWLPPPPSFLRGHRGQAAGCNRR